jgi:putative flavoprotein involved in K+ transport
MTELAERSRAEDEPDDRDRLTTEILIIGAGPAGLAAAVALEDRGIECLLVEVAERPAHRWRKRYDILHLNTTRQLSGLPGRPIPRRAGTYPSADAYASYLENLAYSLDSEILFGQPVEAVQPATEGRWTATTPTARIEAREVVIATGHDSIPRIPEWPGMSGFEGGLFHSSEYRSPERFEGQDVLVVGSGNSGADIATDLTSRTAGRTWMAVRTPPQIIPRTVYGLPMQFVAASTTWLPAAAGDWICRTVRDHALGDLSARGLPKPEQGVSTQFRESGVVPVIDRGDFSAAVGSGAISIVPGVVGFDGPEVSLEDDSVLRPDAIVAATGYRTGLEGLVGEADWLDDRGLPRAHAPESPAGAAGLYFVGFRNPLPGNLLDINRQARKLAAGISRLGN